MSEQSANQATAQPKRKRSKRESAFYAIGKRFESVDTGVSDKERDFWSPNRSVKPEAGR